MAVRFCAAVVGGVVGIGASSSILLARDAFSQYGASWQVSTVPAVGSGSFDTRADFLPDGRRVAVTGNSVYIESAARSGVYDVVGVLDAAEMGSSTDPAFIRVSPDGSRIAIGGGFMKPVAVFATSSLGGPGSPSALTSGAVASYFDVGHYDAEWQDSSHLALSAGDFGSPAYVSLLDVSSNTNAPVNPVIISGIMGFSAGIAFDAAGRLYTGNGYDADPKTGSGTGTIRAFAPSLWAGGAADFETAGSLIGEVLSAGTMHFDLDGNLIVAGGEAGVDFGYVGVINADAIAAALAGSGPIDPSDLLTLRRLDPLGTGSGYFSANFDPSTGELFVIDGTRWYATIPAPAAAGLLVVAGTASVRRRRHA